MPQAIVDPEELRQFALALKKFNENLRDRAQAIGQQLAHLNQTWRDQEHKKFVERFETTIKALARFAEESEQYVPYLIRKAQHAEDYLQS